MKICVLGGCHVAGYPIGSENSFVRRIESYGYIVSWRAHVLISKCSKTLESMRGDDSKYLILQLGNYEFPRPLKKAFVKNAGQTGQVIDSCFLKKETPTGRWSRTKIVMDRCLSLLGMSFAVRKSDLTALESLMGDLGERGFRKVFVLSPLPSDDPWVNYARRKAGAIMKNVTKKYALHFVDVYDAVCGGASKCAIFHDAYHLNADGHAKIASLLIEELQKEMVLERADCSDSRALNPCRHPRIADEFFLA